MKRERIINFVAILIIGTLSFILFAQNSKINQLQTKIMNDARPSKEEVNNLITEKIANSRLCGWSQVSKEDLLGVETIIGSENYTGFVFLLKGSGSYYGYGSGSLNYTKFNSETNKWEIEININEGLNIGTVFFPGEWMTITTYNARYMKVAEDGYHIGNDGYNLPADMKVSYKECESCEEKLFDRNSIIELPSNSPYIFLKNTLDKAVTFSVGLNNSKTDFRLNQYRSNSKVTFPGIERF